MRNQLRAIDLSNVAAHSLQAGLTLSQVYKIVSMCGQPLTKEQKTELRKVRAYLRHDGASAALGF